VLPHQETLYLLKLSGAGSDPKPALLRLIQQQDGWEFASDCQHNILSWFGLDTTKHFRKTRESSKK
jgi:hypothetical protein